MYGNWFTNFRSLPFRVEMAASERMNSDFFFTFSHSVPPVAFPNLCSRDIVCVDIFGVSARSSA